MLPVVKATFRMRGLVLHVNRYGYIVNARVRVALAGYRAHVNIRNTDD